MKIFIVEAMNRYEGIHDKFGAFFSMERASEELEKCVIHNNVHGNGIFSSGDFYIDVIEVTE